MTMTVQAGAAGLGLSPSDVAELTGDCAQVHQRLSALVAHRLAETRTGFDTAVADQAAAGGVGGPGGTAPLARGLPLARAAGRLHAAAAILAEPPASGDCTDDCACARAAAVTVTAGPYPVAGSLVCTLDAHGGDMTQRLADWQAVLAHATARHAVDGGVAVTFDHDLARTAELGRLIAAEYACCSFASYHLTVDAHGVRLEVRAPVEARDAVAALFGVTIS